MKDYVSRRKVLIAMAASFIGTWSETSDPFLNYNFFSCNFEVGRGDFCRFHKGGISIFGVDPLCIPLKRGAPFLGF
jgi:hypothetical protein